MDFEWLLDTPISHRGLHGDTLPENSMGAYALAIEHGYNIEIDVHLTRDHEVVVFHDDTLLRMCGEDKRIEDMTLAELKGYTLKNSSERIPTLKEVLELVCGRVGLLIELKTESSNGALESATYDCLKGYEGNYAIQSFNPLSIKWFKLNAPDIPRGLLSGILKGQGLGLVKRIALERMLLIRVAKPHFIAYCEQRVTRRYVQSKKLPLLAWTIRTPMRARELKNCVDNIIFEGFLPDATHGNRD